MKKFLKPMLLLVFGFTCGVITTCYLSMSASQSFLDIVHINYETEQHIKAIRAKKLGRINQAVIHYANLVEASSSPGLYCFNKKRKYWSMDFPFIFPILERISRHPLAKKGKKVLEGYSRSRFADALEKSGRVEEAMSEYIKAARLMGLGDDIARVKEITNEDMLSDDLLLKLENKYLYPQNVK